MEEEVTNKEIVLKDQDHIVVVAAQGQDHLDLHPDLELEEERSIERAIEEEATVHQVDLVTLQEEGTVEVRVIVEVEAKASRDQIDHLNQDHTLNLIPEDQTVLVEGV